MKDSITAARSRLGALFDGTRASLRSGDRARASDSFGRLRVALEAHFDREDSLYFPAIRALQPELKESLRELTEAHETFRGHFREIGARLERSPLADAGQAFEAFAEAFAAHEDAEEEMLRWLARELASSQ